MTLTVWNVRDPERGWESSETLPANVDMASQESASEQILLHAFRSSRMASPFNALVSDGSQLTTFGRDLDGNTSRVTTAASTCTSQILPRPTPMAVSFGRSDGELVYPP
jgi:hypothetical protein